LENVIRNAPMDGHKNFSMTTTAFTPGLRHFISVKHFFRLLLCRRSFFGFDKPVLAIPNLAHLHLPSADAYTLAKAKELNCPPTNKGVLCTFSAHLAPLSQRRKPQACGIFILLCFNLFSQEPKTTPFNNNTNTSSSNAFMGGTAEDVLKQVNKQAAKQMGHPFQMANYGVINSQQDKLQDYYNETNEMHVNERLLNSQNSFLKNLNNSANTADYKNALDKIKNMLSGKTTLSVKDAYYYTETAFGGSYLNKADYDNTIKQSADFIKKWLTQNKYPLTPHNLQYGLQQFMGKTLVIKDIILDGKNSKKNIVHNPFKYDYADYKGQNDCRNLFLTKCLATGSGQCASLPLVHVAIAQQLGISSYIAFAPFHSYIKFKDENGNISNYEPTSNWALPDKWYQENLFISPKAKQTGIYLNPLSTKQMVANSLVDMVINYANQTSQIDTSFTNQCLAEAQKYFPKNNNIYIHLVNSHILNYQLLYSMKRNNIADISQIPSNSDTHKIYQRLLKNEQLITNLGYQDLPQNMYEQLLKQQNNHVTDSTAKQIKTLFQTK